MIVVYRRLKKCEVWMWKGEHRIFDVWMPSRAERTVHHGHGLANWPLVHHVIQPDFAKIPILFGAEIASCSVVAAMNFEYNL
jgi:hypothetical protein